MKTSETTEDTVMPQTSCVVPHCINQKKSEKFTFHGTLNQDIAEEEMPLEPDQVEIKIERAEDPYWEQQWMFGSQEHLEAEQSSLNQQLSNGKAALDCIELKQEIKTELPDADSQRHSPVIKRCSTDHSFEHHAKNLHSLCRICGLLTENDHPPVPVSNKKNLLKKAFGLFADEDDHPFIHSMFMCQSCLTNASYIEKFGLSSTRKVKNDQMLLGSSALWTPFDYSLSAKLCPVCSHHSFLSKCFDQEKTVSNANLEPGELQQEHAGEMQGLFTGESQQYTLPQRRHVGELQGTYTCTLCECTIQVAYQHKHLMLHYMKSPSEINNLLEPQPAISQSEGALHELAMASEPTEAASHEKTNESTDVQSLHSTSENVPSGLFLGKCQPSLKNNRDCVNSSGISSAGSVKKPKENCTSGNIPKIVLDMLLDLEENGRKRLRKSVHKKKSAVVDSVMDDDSLSNTLGNIPMFTVEFDLEETGETKKRQNSSVITLMVDGRELNEEVSVSESSPQYGVEANGLSDEEWPYTCPVCEAMFKEETSYKNHVKVHRDESLICEVCGDIFFDYDDLKKHREEHTEENSFSSDGPCVCEVCGKMFPQLVDMYQHIHADHQEDDDSCLCEICGEVLPCKNDRSAHTDICGPLLADTIEGKNV